MVKENQLLSTGIVGLDHILKGGLIPQRFYLVRGGPGVGKTTLGLHFLFEALQNGEKPLLITMTEPANKIKENGKKFGFAIDKINFIDLSPKSDFIKDNKDYDVFYAFQVEQEPLIEDLTTIIEDTKPDRIFIDGITQLKYLASDNFNFRKQILSLMHFLMDYETTVMLTSEVGNSSFDDDLQFLVDGIINLQYGNRNHSLEITKYRGSGFKKGAHSLKFKNNGIEVYPLLIPQDSHQIKNQSNEQISSGIPEIDELLHGGIEKATTTTITGPSGVGKTTLGTQFIKESGSKNFKSIIYTFEESNRTLLERGKSINISLDELRKNNNLIIKKVSASEYSLHEFINLVINDINNHDVSIVMLDSISGYFLSFKVFHDEHIMLMSLHDLCNYLTNEGITVLMINEMENITGDFYATEHNTSFLTDNIIFLRYIEIHGKLKKSIGVLKKRMSSFENTMREFKITREGLKVGEPLKNLRGILSGNPEILKMNQDEL